MIYGAQIVIVAAWRSPADFIIQGPFSRAEQEFFGEGTVSVGNQVVNDADAGRRGIFQRDNRVRQFDLPICLLMGG